MKLPKLKPWHWFAAAVGAFILLKDNTSTATVLGALKTNTEAGKTYHLKGRVQPVFESPPLGNIITTKSGMIVPVVITSPSTWEAVIKQVANENIPIGIAPYLSGKFSKNDVVHSLIVEEIKQL